MNINVNQNFQAITPSSRVTPKPDILKPETPKTEAVQTQNMPVERRPSSRLQQSSFSIENLEMAKEMIGKASPQDLRKNRSILARLTGFNPLKMLRGILRSRKPETIQQQPLTQVQTTPTLPVEDTRSPEQQFIAQHKEELNQISRFYCTDIATFNGMVNATSYHTHHDVTVTRREDFEASEERTKAEKSATSYISSSSMKGSFVQDDLSIGHEHVQKARAGCCTTLAVATAHVLTGGQRDTEKNNPKVEVVSYAGGFGTTHYFVLVGRSEDSTLSKPETWGENTLIVDTWLGSMGHDNVFTVDTIPKCARMFLEPNVIMYDSHEPDPPLVSEDKLGTHAQTLNLKNEVNKESLKTREEERLAMLKKQYLEEKEKG